MAASLQHSFFSSLKTISSPQPSTLFSSKSSPFKISFSLSQSNDESSLPLSADSHQTGPEGTTQGPVGPVKLTFERAREYKKLVESSSVLEFKKDPGGNSDGNGEKNGGSKELPDPIKAAMEKAREYKKNNGDIAGAKSEGESRTGLNETRNTQNGVVEKVKKKEELTISSIDFVGLNFSDKQKSKGLPPGLVPVSDPFPEGDLPEVEIIVGDTSNFGDATTSKPKPTTEDDTDLYKPRVSTWGVFPRPGDISKTFGGGRTIRPGDVLETEEDRASKNERTRQLLSAYKRKVGLNVDPKLKLECEQALNDGDSCMDSGKLKEALPYYEKVMNKMQFQSELHGLAALQWSICQDSLSRRSEARNMYEKLQSHPNADVSKKARQFMFSFQAMEMMKVTGSNPLLINTGYQNYFEAFVEDKANYTLQAPKSEDGALSQALPYILFLISPIFIVLLIALQKGM